MIESGPPALRRGTAADLTELAAIHAASFGAEAWSARAFRDLLAMRGAHLLLAEGDAAATAGFILYLVVGEDVEVLTLAVLPAFRRRGVGSTLVGAAMLDASRQGARRILLEVAEDNGPARALYAALGFASAGRRADYYRRPGVRPVAAQLLRRAIVAPPGHDP